MLYCLVDKNNIVTNIINSPYMVPEESKKYNVWNKIGDTYTDVEPPEYANQREAADMKSKLQQNP